jgi:hypothetical protein
MGDVRELVVTCTECGALESALVPAGKTAKVTLAHAPSCVYGQAVKAGPTAVEGYLAKHNFRAPLSVTEAP